MHLGELELCFGADAGREGRVADEVAEGLPVGMMLATILHRLVVELLGAAQSCELASWAVCPAMGCWIVPLGLKLGKHLALCVVANDVGGKVTTKVHRLGPEHRHCEVCLVW